MIVPGSKGRIALVDLLSASEDTLLAASEYISAIEQKYYEKKYAAEEMEGGGLPPDFAAEDTETLSEGHSGQDVGEEMWREVHEQHHQDL